MPMQNERPLREVKTIAPLGARAEDPAELEAVHETTTFVDEPQGSAESTAPPPQESSPAPQPVEKEADKLEPAEYLSAREVLARMDEAWGWFRAAAGSFPSEHMDEHLHDGWTRKQMLAHVAAWHDRTHDRLGTLISTDMPDEVVDDVDRFNARVARQAIGRTAGEIIKEMEGTYNRLRRRVAQLSSEQLAAHDGWAISVIAGNSYDHYEEHRDDVRQAETMDPRQGRR